MQELAKPVRLIQKKAYEALLRERRGREGLGIFVHGKSSLKKKHGVGVSGSSRGIRLEAKQKGGTNGTTLCEHKAGESHTRRNS